MNIIGLQVIDAVTRHYDISIPDLIYGGRKKQISRARGMACFLLRKHANLTYQNIGKLLGIDHTTAMYHYNQISGALDPNTVAERHEAEQYYNLIASMEYDAKIPF